MAENGPQPTAPPRFAVHIAYLGRHVEFGVLKVICCSFFIVKYSLFRWTEAKGYDHLSWWNGWMYTLFMLEKLWILIGILKQVGWPAGNDHCPLSKTDFFLHSLQLQIWPASQPAFDKKKHYKSFETTARCTNISTNMPESSWQLKCDLETIFLLTVWSLSCCGQPANPLQPNCCCCCSLCTLLYPSTDLPQKAILAYML